MGHDVVDLRRRQRAGIGRKHLLIVGRVIAEIAADRNDPAILGLIEHDAVAPVGIAAGNDHGKPAAQIARTAAIDARGVADADFYFLFHGARIAERLHAFEKQYGLTSEEFAQCFATGEIGESLDYIEWAGEIETYRRLEGQWQALQKATLH